MRESSSSSRDYILRLIAQLGAALARAAGSRRAGQHLVALEELDAAAATLLGPNRPLLERIDARSAAALLGDPALSMGWARLLAEEASVRTQMDQAGTARTSARRAVELALEACMGDPQLAAEARQLLLALGESADVAGLPDRYRVAARAIDVTP